MRIKERENICFSDLRIFFFEKWFTRLLFILKAETIVYSSIVYYKILNVFPKRFSWHGKRINVKESTKLIDSFICFHLLVSEGKKQCASMPSWKRHGMFSQNNWDSICDYFHLVQCAGHAHPYSNFLRLASAVFLSCWADAHLKNSSK